MIHKKYYEIMKQFLGDYNKEIYGRELVKKINISQKNIALTLEELEKVGILSSKTKGNMKYFSVNKLNPLFEKYLLLTEVENSIIFFRNHPRIREILEKIGKKGNIICVFGSYAKGINKKSSDLDLFIVGNIDEKKIKSVGKDYGVSVDIKCASKKGFISMLKKNEHLINEILRNHVIISGFEEFVREVCKWMK